MGGDGRVPPASEPAEVGEWSPIDKVSTRGTPSSRRGRAAGTRPGHTVAGTVAAEPSMPRTGPAVG